MTDEAAPARSDADYGLVSTLHATTDAAVWAKAFMDRFGGEDAEGRVGVGPQIDEGLMIGWFANAMYAQESKDSRDKHLVDTGRLNSGDDFSFSVHEGERLTLKAAVYQALGAASTCWTEDQGEGRVFDDRQATHVGETLMAFIGYHYVEVQRVQAGADYDTKGIETLPAVGDTVDDGLGNRKVVIEVIPEHGEVVYVSLPIEPAS